MRRLEKIKQITIVFICILVLMILILCPLIMIFKEAIIVEGRLNLAYAIDTIWNNENIVTIKNSIILGIAVVIMSSVLAGPLAFLMAKTELGKHKWLDIVVLIPFMTPPYISSMGWILFVQKKGLLQQLMPFTANISEKFFCFGGLVLIMSLHVFPFMVTILKNALLNINSNLEEAAALFGAGFGYRLKKILLPLLTGNYAIGALLVFVKTLSEYGTPATFGNRIGFYVFTTDIHRHSTIAPIDFGKAAALSAVLIGICLWMWFIQNDTTNKNSYLLVSGKGVRNSIAKLSGVKKMAAWFYIIVLLILAIGIPYFSVIATSLIKLRGYGLVAGNFTFEHYISLFTQNPKGRSAIMTSTILAVLSATISAIIGTILVVVIRQMKNNKAKKLVEAISLLPEMLPGIVLVIGLILFWNGVYKVVPLYNTLGMMVLAYVVLYLPYTVQYVTSSFSQINDNLIQAGKTFGASSVYIFLHITLPLVLKGVITAWTMTFIISFRELVAASMLAPPNTLTISTFIVREFEQGSVSVGMAMAVICVLLTTSILMVLNYFGTDNKNDKF
jgi:iron(III) transport system permease protein